MGRHVQETISYSVGQTSFGRILARITEVEGEATSRVLAFTRGELGFFADGMRLETDRAEVGRFLGRCVDCREPVAIPYYAVAEMASWTGEKGYARNTEDWRRQLIWWLTKTRGGGFRSTRSLALENEVDVRTFEPLTDRQRRALLLLRADLEDTKRRKAPP